MKKAVSIFQEFGVNDPITVEMDSDTAAFLIQRAWRRYRSNGGGCWPPSGEQLEAEEEVAQRTLATSGYMTTSISSCFSSDMRTSNSFSDWRVSASNTEDNLGGAAIAAAPGTSAEPPTPLRSRRLEQLKEADSLSIMSDCSELMGEVGKLLKEQLSSQDTLLRPRLHLPGSRSAATLTPRCAADANAGRAAAAAAAAATVDDDEDARREQRKANFLSLAQEFAELKRRNADALPFNLHRLGRACSSPAPSTSAATTESSASPVSSPISLQVESSESPEDDEERFRLVQVPLVTDAQASQAPPLTSQCGLRREDRLQGLFPQQQRRQAGVPGAAAEGGETAAEAAEARQGLSERERVLQALSMSAEDEEAASCLLLTSSSGMGGPASLMSGLSVSGASAAKVDVSCVGAAGGGMEMCFRNDAASDSECSDAAPPATVEFVGCGDAGGGGDGGGESGSCQQQRRQQRRTARGFTAPKVSEAAAPMQLCFISDLTSDEEDSASANSSTLVSDSGIGDPFKPDSRRRQPQLESGCDLAESQCTSVITTATSSSLATVANTSPDDASGACASGGDNEDLLARQARLQAEAQLALAQARPMAKMQLEVERHEQRSRASRDVVAELIGVSSTAARRFHLAHLQQLSVGALQLIHNDLLCRIEAHNEELVRSLIERDDLHMEQDAMLVEIEDLTRRAQEVANRLQEAPQAASSPGKLQSSPQLQATDKSPSAAAASAASPVRRKMSSLTQRLKPNKLVSLFTGGN